MARWLLALLASTLIYGLASTINSVWWAFMLGIVASTAIDLIRGNYK